MLIALGIAAAVFLALLAIRELAVRRLGRRPETAAGESPAGVRDLLAALGRRSQVLVIAAVSLYLGGLYLTLRPGQERTLRGLAETAVLLQLALWSSVAIDFWLARQRRRLDHDATSVALAGVLRFVAKLVLWALLLMMALDNLGVNVTTLITGLGIGGVAVALALQNVLGDLLASLSIVLDKPFVLGDAITVDALTGTVESIGLKTTRLRAVSGEQLVFANGDLLKSRIHNWKRMAERRVVLAFGVPLGTPADTVERIPGLVRALVEGTDLVRFDRAHFKGIGASSLDFEAVYWLLTPDYNAFMDRQQAIGLGLLRALEREGIELASGAPTVLLTTPKADARVGGNVGEGLVPSRAGASLPETKTSC
ncbi:MAG TPA: mechanosensitive ion channel family protein [Thermoanaerobaculia bacterium]